MNMKNKVLCLPALLLVLVLSAIYFVNNRVVVKPLTYGYSYSEQLERYETLIQELGIDAEVDSGLDVAADRFRNTTPSNISSFEDAIELAKKECTVKYNTIEYAFDEEDDMWKIVFHYEYRVPPRDVFGGDQTVYIRSDGVTQAIVYGK